jgi:hypothetical protein
LIAVRFVRRKDAQPEVGMLVGEVSHPKQHFLVYNKVPYTEDVRPFAFPSFETPLRKEYAPSSQQVGI